MASTRVLSIAVVAGFVGVLTTGHPAWAQMAGTIAPDLSGSWLPDLQEEFNERSGEGPLPSDYSGLPLNAEGRAISLSTPVSRYSLLERQCAMYPPHYLAVGPFGMKIWPELDPLSGVTIAYHIGAWQNRAETVIWLDGRPHPPANAPHTDGGFETGEWRGNTLVTHTTHIKAGQIRRNGAQVSDQTTLTTYFVVHGNLLSLLMFIDDPVNLSEPVPISRQFRMDFANTLPSMGPPCFAAYEGTDVNAVPSFLPEENPMIGELRKEFGIPPLAQLGGAETMYPEFRKKLKGIYVRPDLCTKYCGGSGSPIGDGAPEGLSGSPGAGPPPRSGAPRPR